MLGLLFGIIIGFSLGLTGGGGSIFAVPLLVYGMQVPVHQAVGISLAAVAATATFGAINRIINAETELRIGLLFGASGILGAPAGTWIGARLPEMVLLGGFALLMLVVAVRMWRQAGRHPDQAQVVRAGNEPDGAEDEPVCRQDPDSGRMRLTSHCTLVLLSAGFITGLLSGLFGVGGGFIIVPALLLVASLPIRRSVATSLLVIAIVSAAGVVSHALAGQHFDWSLTGLFVMGGLVGISLGNRLSRRLAGPVLQRIFAVTMIALAIFILVRDVLL
ncbi:MAG: sulfite exporter TauE/SafE family protein [Candidatus Competibacteraceae bacterium]|nr:sulfite exporter TauE/SafE family protein [Candidatus Competibacteraceae bacterium]